MQRESRAQEQAPPIRTDSEGIAGRAMRSSPRELRESELKEGLGLEYWAQAELGTQQAGVAGRPVELPDQPASWWVRRPRQRAKKRLIQSDGERNAL